MTRRLIGKRAMSNAEKQQRYRDLRNPKSKLSQQLARKQRRDKLERALAAATITAWYQLGTRRFPVLYVDWPSRIEPWSRETGLNKAADNHFPTMPFDEVRHFPLPAADNCVLFMWIANEWNPRKHLILEAHGFEERANAVWDKGQADGTGRMGLGHWFRYEHEPLILAVRGEMPAPVPGTQWRSVFRAPPGRHSEKPEAVAEMITAYYPNLPKLEMFYRALDDPEAERLRRAKREAAGWYFWGNEAEAAPPVVATVAQVTEKR
jgi:N6-adenosine-specific RNA methylase IME4